MRVSSSTNSSTEASELLEGRVKVWVGMVGVEGPASSAGGSGRRARGWGLAGGCRRMMTAGLEEDALFERRVEPRRRDVGVAGKRV